MELCPRQNGPGKSPSDPGCVCLIIDALSAYSAAREVVRDPAGRSRRRKIPERLRREGGCGVVPPETEREVFSMSKRCRQCGRILGDGEGEFCSSGCKHQFERENPGKLAKEKKNGCVMQIILAIIVAIGFLVLKAKGAF